MRFGGQFVFGYGSLAAGASRRPARLDGYRRVWGVAMDNRVDIPGYKYYLLRADGSRPDVHVAFLDIVEDGAATTSGALIEADEALLRALDERERNYDRIDVTGAVARAPGTVWAYRGSAAGRERLQTGRRRGSAVVDRQYLAGVQAGLERLGVERDADPGELALMDLERVDLPPAR